MYRYSLLAIFVVLISACEAVSQKNVPPGMNPDLFPVQVFDKNTPICQLEREPCGFYSFSLSDETPFKWIKSWCHCTAGSSCVYEKTDMKMRVYRHFCIDNSEIDGSDDMMDEESTGRKQADNDDYMRAEKEALQKTRRSHNRVRQQIAKTARRRKMFEETDRFME